MQLLQILHNYCNSDLIKDCMKLWGKWKSLELQYWRAEHFTGVDIFSRTAGKGRGGFEPQLITSYFDTYFWACTIKNLFLSMYDKNLFLSMYDKKTLNETIDLSNQVTGFKIKFLIFRSCNRLFFSYSIAAV